MLSVMTSRRSLAFLALLLARPAASQIRTVPVEASAPSLSFRSGAPAAPSLGPSFRLSGPALAPGASPPVAPAAAPAARVAAPAAALAPPLSVLAAPLAAPPAASPLPLLAARAEPAAPLPVAPAGSPGSPVRESRGPQARSALASAAATSGAAPDAALGVLFDGGPSRPSLAAAADGPEAGPPVSRPSLKPSRWRRALGFAGYAVPAAVLVGVAGAVAPHAALTGVHWLGQAAYWLANPFAFMFTVPQVHRMLSRRSADVSAGMIAVGLLAAATATLNFAFDGKDLMMYRNLAQVFGFAAMFGLQRHYARSPNLPRPTTRRAVLEAVGLGLAVVGLMFAAGPALLAAVPGLALMSALLVPFQIASGFGFTYLMYAQLTKMIRANSAGDSSPAMMWAYLGTKTIWLWSLATMVSLATAPAWLTLPAAAGFAALCWILGRAALSRLLHAPWSFLPEKLTFRGRTLTRERLVDIGAFTALSALILVLSGAGYLAFVDVLGVPAAAAPRFAMYLLYMVQSLVACLATLKTLQLSKQLKKVL